jgi:hypothetical protein
MLGQPVAEPLQAKAGMWMARDEAANGRCGK